MSNAQTTDAGEQVVAVLVGPTAAGKSALALEAAQRSGMEIVNADAFCLYRRMDIGTAKPTPEDRARVPHHVIDTHDVSDAVDVAWYQQAARAAVVEIWQRGRTPLLTGGSGLYVHGVLDDLQFPGTDADVRSRLEAELEQLGPAELHRRLESVDPAAASHILATNGRRIVRALEVNEITGRSFVAVLGDVQPWCRSVRIGWDPGVDEVDRAIESRVDAMWDAGLVDEVLAIRPELEASRTASRAVGYRQILDVLAADQDPVLAKEPTVAATRRLARKQRAWFRRDPKLRWAQSPSQVHEILGRLEA
ncbi:MAG: tRNA (adenosine(37)-N6)-dimethylallyltransferase MiaA [Candidatus Nanopelagicales bacterium]